MAIPRMEKWENKKDYVGKVVEVDLLSIEEITHLTDKKFKNMVRFKALRSDGRKFNLDVFPSVMGDLADSLGEGDATKWVYPLRVKLSAEETGQNRYIWIVGISTTSLRFP